MRSHICVLVRCECEIVNHISLYILRESECEYERKFMLHAVCDFYVLCEEHTTAHLKRIHISYLLRVFIIRCCRNANTPTTCDENQSPSHSSWRVHCTLTQLAHTMHVGNAILEMNMNGKKIEFNANMNGVSSLTFFVIVTRFSIIFGASMWDALRGFYGAASCDFCILLSSARRHFFSEAERSDS